MISSWQVVDPSVQVNEGFVSWRGFPADKDVALPRAELCAVQRHVNSQVEDRASHKNG